MRDATLKIVWFSLICALLLCALERSGGSGRAK